MLTVLVFTVITLFPIAANSQYPWGYAPYGYPGAQGIPPTHPAPNTDQQKTPSPRFRQPSAPRMWHQQPGGWPAQAAAPPKATPPTEPIISTSVSTYEAIEQQNLIYRIRISSDGNLKTATAQPPQSEGFAIRSLGKPKNSSRKQDAQQKIITEYTYLLIPLRPGQLTLGAAMVTGEYDDGTPYTAQASLPLTLTVKPAIKGVEPWLPLYNLRIQAQLLDATNLKAGSPVTLEVSTTASGSTGAQIPSVANQLKSRDYRLYPTESSTVGKLSANGFRLEGQRIERFTLVPHYGGKLSIPALQLRWWDINQKRLRTTTVPIRQFNVKGPAGPTDSSNNNGDSLLPTGSLLFWIPLVCAALLLVGGWLNILFGNGRLPGANWLAWQFRNLLGELYNPLAALGRRFSPRRYFHRLRTWIGRNLPVSWKLWFCLRSLDKENDAEEWGHALQILAHKHLGVRSHASLQELGASIAACHPRANADQVSRLMHELDRSIYGVQPLQSFNRWRKSFKRQIKPRLFPIRFKHCSQENNRQQGLPGLNPVN